MTTTRRLLAVSLLAASLVLWVAPVSAEVSVEVDAGTGKYLGYTLQANSSTQQPRIWEFKRTGKKGVHPLNPTGDETGDGYPALTENAADRGHPWVVWVRGTGSRPLVYSRWTGAEWSATRGVEAASEPQSAPALDFNSAGRAYLAYRQERPGGGHEVHFTLFLKTVWAVSLTVSGGEEDAGQPSLNIVDDRTVEITYELPDGTRRTVTVVFADPHTITDDVYPFLTDTAQITEGILG